jgi:putative ABC transport system ATP-binding protein
MITHSIPHALAVGTRTVMLSRGAVALDLGSEARRGLTTADLLAQYKELNTDRMVLE